MKKALHVTYMLIGHLFCKCCLLIWTVRDMVRRPSEDTVLFVAHPDDDVLFFHSFIKQYHPYVVLLTTGWSLRRMPGFFKVMRHYGVHFRAYDMATDDNRTALLEQRVKSILDKNCFKRIATHNALGEYGHSMHIKVHQAVVSVAKQSVFVPVSKAKIMECPLSTAEVMEKKELFQNYYATELFVLDQYKDWVNYEGLCEVN